MNFLSKLRLQIKNSPGKPLVVVSGLASTREIDKTLLACAIGLHLAWEDRGLDNEKL